MIKHPQSTSRRAILKVYLSDGITEATGKIVAVVISKNGGVFGNPAGGATNAIEIGNGWYYVDLAAGDLDTLGALVVRGTSAGCDSSERVFDVVNPHNSGFDGIPNAVAGASSGLPLLSQMATTNDIAAAVWSYIYRTLTQGAAAVAAAVSGANVGVYNSIDIDFTLTGLVDFTAWTRLYFTVKKSSAVPDADAVFQLALSNPGGANDGLLILNGAAYTPLSNGQILVLSTTSIRVKIKAAAAQLLPALSVGVYDVKAVVSGLVVPVSEGGLFAISNPTTKAIT